jgi:hypothetical protein
VTTLRALGRLRITQATRLQSGLRLLDSVAAAAGVLAVRAGDAAHGILRERGGDGAEAEEGGKGKGEREFHDPAPLVQGIAWENGFAALRDKLCFAHPKRKSARTASSNHLRQELRAFLCIIHMTMHRVHAIRRKRV